VISRARESQADCTGAELMNEGESLASALKKISRFSNEDISVGKRHEYPSADAAFIESTKFLFIAEPNSNELVENSSSSDLPFDVNGLNDPNDNWFTWGLSWFSSHPPTRQRVADLEAIDKNLSRRAALTR